MYFPYLRGKEFELLALLDVNPSVYNNTIPILEPVSASERRKLFQRIGGRNFPLILITNPYYPLNERLTPTQVQNIIHSNFATHTQLTPAFIIDNRFDIASLNGFLTANPTRGKALIFRNNPLPADLHSIQIAITMHPVQYFIFDDKKTNTTTRSAFASNGHNVLLTDGFQRQDRNSDYPATSTFDSNYNTWSASGLMGIGDYLNIGDHFQPGGGQVLVITLHITTLSGATLLVNHFSSTVHSTTQGFAAQKFAQANNLLVSSPIITPLTSRGLTMFRDWHRRKHNPQLGAAKQASIMHHIELMSSIV